MDICSNSSIHPDTERNYQNKNHQKHLSAKSFVQFDVNIGIFGFKTPFHVLGEHSGMNELYQANVKSEGYICIASFLKTQRFDYIVL